MIDNIQKVLDFLLSLKKYNIDIIIILCVNGSMQFLKIFKLRIKSTLKKYFIWLFFNFIFSFFYSLLFLLPEFSFLVYIKTSFLTFLLSSMLYEIIKSIKPIKLLKEYLYNKFKKEKDNEKNI